MCSWHSLMLGFYFWIRFLPAARLSDRQLVGCWDIIPNSKSCVFQGKVTQASPGILYSGIICALTGGTVKPICQEVCVIKFVVLDAFDLNLKKWNKW